MFKKWQFLDTASLLQPLKEWPWDGSHDAMQASTKNHTVLFENDEVRILEVTINPQEKEDFHTHRWKSVFIVDALADMRYFGPQGEIQYERKAPPADAFCTSVTWKEPEGLHAIENLSHDRVIHGIRIEMKD